MINSLSSWTEKNFQKRECHRFIASCKQSNRCLCGRSYLKHRTCSENDLPDHKRDQQPVDSHVQCWNPLHHSVASPTDAFGTLEFQGTSHSLKSKYVRVSYDTRPELLLQLMTREWDQELPKVVISVHGGKANFQLQPKLKKVLQEGLVRAAKTVGAWIFSAGTNTGVMRHVGDARKDDRSPYLHGNRVVIFGIAPWGIVQNRERLIGKHGVVPYYSASSPKNKLSELNSHHSYFILADNGTVGRYGAEIVLRKKLERYISKQQIFSYGENRCSLPVVCVLVEGGVNCIRTVLEYLTDNPPVPVVICDGTGRSADLIAFAHKYLVRDKTTPLEIRRNLLEKIESTFQVDREKSEQLFCELVQCIRRADLITVFRMGEEPYQDLDQAILTALLRQPHLRKCDQLNLALTWNRIDIARIEIFGYGVQWPMGSLEQALMDALVLDRVEFVHAILENGISMQRFLTVARLEELYNTVYGPENILQHLVRDHIHRGSVYRLYDIGLVVEKLMGGSYRSQYCKGIFRTLYVNVAKQSVGKRPTFSGDFDMPFMHPFNELLIWAVLTMRQKMALYVWQQGKGSLVRALVASKLYKAMSKEASDNDFEEELHFRMLKYAREFDKHSLDLLDFYYRRDEALTLQILTHELTNWSKQTCLGLAVMGHHHAFLAHISAQVLVADLWMGGLRIRKTSNLKVILGLIFPLAIPKLRFKTKEELRRMPQTEAEHQLELEDYVGGQSLPRSQPIDIETNERSATEKRKKPPMDRQNSVLSIAQIPVSHSLSLGKKIYEFYAAPITKFWSNVIAYVVFVIFYTYVVLVKTTETLHWTECYTIAYQFTIFLEKIREIVSAEPEKLRAKLLVWSEKLWNPCDLVVVIFFFVGVAIRLDSREIAIARIFYCLAIMYWYLRILDMFSVSKNLGPYVTMMSKMTLNMIYVVILLMVIMMSYGVARQGIMYPNEEPSWSLIREVFFKPYWMVYGELFVDSIDPPCGEGNGMPPCHPGLWINPAIMTIYLLLANLLLVNLLIAVFNNIFNEVSAVSQQLWKSHRYWVVLEFEQKPLLPPPFIVISHLIFLVRVCVQSWKRKSISFDHGLKLFCDESTIDKIHTFEELCMDSYLNEMDGREFYSTKEQIKLILSKSDLVHEISQETCTQTASNVQNLCIVKRQVDETLKSILDLQNELHDTLALQSTYAQEGRISMEVELDAGNQYKEDREESGSDEMSVQQTSSSGTQKHSTDKERKQNKMVVPRRQRPLRRSLSQPITVKNRLVERSRTSIHLKPGSTPFAPVGVVCPYLSHQKPTWLNYRTITEDLEDVARTYSPGPSTKHSSQSSMNSESELALAIQAANLRDAENEDYNFMEGLIQRRLTRDSEDLDASLDDLCDLLDCQRTEPGERLTPPSAFVCETAEEENEPRSQDVGSSSHLPKN